MELAYNVAINNTRVLTLRKVCPRGQEAPKRLLKEWLENEPHPSFCCGSAWGSSMLAKCSPTEPHPQFPRTLSI